MYIFKKKHNNVLKKSFKLMVCFFIFLNSSVVFAESFNLSIYFRFDDQETMDLSENEKYLQIKASSVWEDSFGDYGIADCLGYMTVSKNAGTKFNAYCEGENQNNDKFWLKYFRNSEDMDAGTGLSTYVNGTGKYKELIGLQCPYAVKYFKDRAFFKQKCKL